MSVKIISNNKRTITLEVIIDIDENENFLQTEEHIMDKVNEVGQILTKEAMENLDIQESAIKVEGQRLYAKKKLKSIKLPTERQK